MRPAVLIHNRAAGQPTRPGTLEAVVEALAAHGWEAEARSTTGPGTATGMAREAAAEGAEAVFALGGDGTLRETAAGLLDTGVPLGPLPGGTANVLTLALGLPRHPLEAVPVVCGGPPRRLVVGRCGEEIFLMMASGGLDANVLTHVDPVLKRRFSKAYIVWEGLYRWWRYRYPVLEVEAAGRRYRASFVVASNIPLYGGGFALTPDARPEEESLELLLFSGSGRLQTLFFVGSILRGRHLERDDVQVLSVPEARIGGPEDVVLQVDGDPSRERPPVTVTVAPEELLVLAPGTGEAVTTTGTR